MNPAQLRKRNNHKASPSADAGAPTAKPAGTPSFQAAASADSNDKKKEKATSAPTPSSSTTSWPAALAQVVVALACLGVQRCSSGKAEPESRGGAPYRLLQKGEVHSALLKSGDAPPQDPQASLNRGQRRSARTRFGRR